MKKKYKIVFTHMNSTHWEVEAYDKDEATRKGLELSEDSQKLANKYLEEEPPLPKEEQHSEELSEELSEDSFSEEQPPEEP